MKNFILPFCAASVLLFSSCNSEPSWNKQDEEQLIENCLHTVAVNLPEKTAVIYCDCQLEYLKENYSSGDEVRKIIKKDPQGLQGKIQENCLDYAKKEARKDK